MYTLVASKIKNQYKIIPPPLGRRCFICIEDFKIEIVWVQVKGCAGGFVGYFVCPVTGKRCRKLHLVGGQLVHSSAIKNFYRKIWPPWYKDDNLGKLLKKQQAAIDGANELNKPFFKRYYAGKPTKRYLRCLKQIEESPGISIHELVNGGYDYLLKSGNRRM